jgi:hypothetical protein
MKVSVKVLHAALAVIVAMLSTSIHATPPLNLHEPVAVLAGGDRCPPHVGRFHMVGSSLNVTIEKRRDKAVTPPQTQLVANPPAESVAESLAKRGRVEFDAHVDADSGQIFVHWETVRSVE